MLIPIEWMVCLLVRGLVSDSIRSPLFSENIAAQRRIDLCGNRKMATSKIFMKSLFKRATNQIDSLWV